MLLSSWCGPCQAAFPAFDSLLVKYEKDSTVHFYGVDIWERTTDKVTAIEQLMSKSARSRTTPEFAEWLVTVARTARMDKCNEEFEVVKNQKTKGKIV